MRLPLLLALLTPAPVGTLVRAAFRAAAPSA